MIIIIIIDLKFLMKQNKKIKEEKLMNSFS
jgi:hypothetical protein